MTIHRGMMICALFLAPITAQAFDHEHRAFEAVLTEFVRDGMVDYAGLKTRPAELDRYLAETAGVSETDFEAWSQDQQLAFLINLYNAATLKLILDHYPLKSIRDIGTFFKGPWDQPVVGLWGGLVTLNHLEHDIIRKRYAVPEIHFALVCAAKGCPPLRGDAYKAEKLADQLADQRRLFLASPTKNAIEPERRRVKVSPIFKWFAGDFEKAAGSVTAYLKTHWPSVEEDFAIHYSHYDWRLNGQ